MNLQSQAVSTALALFPVYPPQWVRPVQPPSIAHGGIPLAAFTPQGLEVVIEPITGLLNWVVAAFDVVTLFVNGARTNVSKTIMPGEEGDRFLLYLPEFWFTNGVNDVRYQVTRVSGNKDDSPTLQLLYHNPAPTISVSHPPSIGPGQTAVITITIGYPRPYDTVTLTIGTWSITFNNPAPTGAITYTLTAADLQQIGDGTHSVFGRVFDQLFNSGVSTRTSIDISANQKLVVPTLTNVLDVNNNEVPEGTNTTSKMLTLKGLASPGLNIEGFDGSGPSAVSLGTATADATTDIWELKISIQPGVHRLYAKSLYHPGPVYSNVRNLTVSSDLSIDTSDMRLAGFSVKIFIWPRTGRESVGNTDDRQPTGGVPPYNHVSQNPAIASVDQNGHVTGNRNGTTIIVVTDTLGNYVQYRVVVSNVWTLQVNNNRMSSASAIAWMYSIGGSPIPPSQFISDASNCYNPPLIRPEEIWVCYLTSAAANFVMQQTGFTYGTRFDDAFFPAWCMTPY